MPAAVGFLAGVLAAIALMFGAIGGAFIKILSGEDDFDADDDPFDAFPYPPPTQEA